MTPIEYRAELERAVASHVRRGAVVLYGSDIEVLMTYPGKSINNVLHAVLTLFTFGMWLPAWALVAIYCAANGEKRFTLRVNEYGAVDSDFARSQPSIVNPWMVIGGILLLLIILASI